MPTKIVSGPSNSQNGEINADDLKKISDDFEQSVNVTSTGEREIHKLNFVSIPVLLVEHLLGKLNGIDKFNSNLIIRFGITLPGQTDCVDGVTDVSDHLTAVLLLEKNGQELSNVDDFIITPGFKEQGDGAANAACCPVIT